MSSIYIIGCFIAVGLLPEKKNLKFFKCIAFVLAWPYFIGLELYEDDDVKKWIHRILTKD